jgi:hypothetical protein
MRRIRVAIIALFMLLLLTVVGNIVISTIGLFIDERILNLGSLTPESTGIVQILFVLKTVALLVFMYGVFCLVKGLMIISDLNLFDLRLAIGFKRVGILFCASGILGLCTSIVTLAIGLYSGRWIQNIYLNIDSKSLYFMLLILGLFFLLFAKVQLTGSEIKNENELTI